jgi:hypothetical protein
MSLILSHKFSSLNVVIPSSWCVDGYLKRSSKNYGNEPWSMLSMENMGWS